MNSEISPIIREKAPIILAEIKKAKSVLLHCHPSPDPDSVGSALAMKFALEGMGKNVTVIKGDSEMPKGYRNFPGMGSVLPKNLGEIDLKSFDLFLILDSATEGQISRLSTPVFPLSIPSVVIDHHISNQSYADINLVEPLYPATCHVLFDLFTVWGVSITPDIAKNLFIGLYTDTGGFKYKSTTSKTIAIAAKLAEIAPDYHSLISDIQSNNTPGQMAYEGLALSAIETFHEDKLAISAVSFTAIKKKTIPMVDVRVSEVSSFMRSVPEWCVCIAMASIDDVTIRVSSRSSNADVYDVSQLMASVGGGGHKGAAGATVVNMSLDEAKAVLVAKAKELYNL